MITIQNKITVFLFKSFEFVALGLEPFDALGEGCAELVDGLEGVVEGDDASRARVPYYIVDNALGGEPLGVVASNKVPHDNLVTAGEQEILDETHPSVRRPEEMAADVGIGMLHVVVVLVDGAVEGADVVVGVVAHLMALVDDALIEMGIAAHVVADHEKGGMDAMLLENVEDVGGSLGNGTVIEGQVY